MPRLPAIFQRLARALSWCAASTRVLTRNGRLSAKIDNAIITAGIISAWARDDCRFGNKNAAILGASVLARIRMTKAIKDNTRKAEET